jgi:dUTP pyrophosphatase
MIKVKLLSPNAKVPIYGSELAAGMDLHIAQPGSIEPGERKMFHTDIAIEIPHGFYGQVAPRSSLAKNYGIDTLAGVIDADYRGEVTVLLINHGDAPVTFAKGDRIAQLIVKPCNMEHFQVVDNLSKTARDTGGFGSTGA